jgi:small subunit ribosomal protein S5e
MSKAVEKVTLEEEKGGKAGFENAPKLFSKWSYDDIKIEDPCFIDYIAAKGTKAQVFVPHTAGRYQSKKFRKALCPIVERLVGSLQFHGRNTGKKVKAIRIVRHAFEIINLLTGKNPLEVLVNAIVAAGPREDSTRIGAGGVVRKQAVDVSPMRRVNQAIYLITQGVREHAFRSQKSIAEVLADEIINVEKGNLQSSYALKKKEEIEKVAKGNR